MFFARVLPGSFLGPSPTSSGLGGEGANARKGLFVQGIFPCDFFPGIWGNLGGFGSNVCDLQGTVNCTRYNILPMTCNVLAVTVAKGGPKPWKIRRRVGF